MNSDVDLAKAAVALLERVEVRGREVPLFIEVNQFLGKIALETHYLVSRPPPEKKLEAPSAGTPPPNDGLQVGQDSNVLTGAFKDSL